VRIGSADEFASAFKAALDSDEPYLLDVPMENIAVPTPDCWNINDIYRPSDLVSEGKLAVKENGKYVAPGRGRSHRT
jgi:acetolactate synthase-1/2/3 large subunit